MATASAHPHASLALRPSWTFKVYQPGDTPPHSGIYTVFHSRQHAQRRAPYRVSLLAGQPLPACSVCGFQLRYRLDEVADDYDAASPLVLAA